MSSHKVVAEYKSLLRSVIQGFGLVSLGLERILDSFVPKTVSVRRLDLDHFKVFVVSLGMGQILGSNVLKTVGVGWLDIKKIVSVLRERVSSIPGLRAVKW